MSSSARRARGDIDDKSKADALAKTLVILQASWMLLQVLGRLIAELPVTLLEVNTVAHILCAFSMYTMWWNKPLTPKEPIIAASGDWTPELLAFRYVSSEVSGAVDEKRIKSQTIVKTLFASLHVYSKTPEMEHVCLRSRDILEEPDGIDSRLKSGTTRWGGRPTCQGHTRECEKVLQCKRLEKELGTAFFERRPRVHAAGANKFSADICAQNRRELIANAIQRYEPASEQLLVEHQTSNDVTCVYFKPEQLLTECSRNWPSDELLRDVGGLVVGMVLWLANFLCGGIHAAGWNDHFPRRLKIGCGDRLLATLAFVEVSASF